MTYEVLRGYFLSFRLIKLARHMIINNGDTCSMLICHLVLMKFNVMCRLIIYRSLCSINISKLFLEISFTFCPVFSRLFLSSFPIIVSALKDLNPTFLKLSTSNSTATRQVMWNAVERALGPGFNRGKCEVKLVGTPLTHKRFLRRNRGTYGPAIQAGKDTFPGHPTPIPQLYCCGDSTFPGIGVPAVAASGAIVANSLVSVSQHSQLLDAVGI